jgi:hypothetical protein
VILLIVRVGLRSKCLSRSGSGRSGRVVRGERRRGGRAVGGGRAIGGVRRGDDGAHVLVLVDGERCTEEPRLPPVGVLAVVGARQLALCGAEADAAVRVGDLHDEDGAPPVARVNEHLSLLAGHERHGGERRADSGLAALGGMSPAGARGVALRPHRGLGRALGETRVRPTKTRREPDQDPLGSLGRNPTAPARSAVALTLQRPRH